MALLRLRGAVPARCAAPTSTTFLATTGAPFHAISPLMGSSSWSASFFRSTTPRAPKSCERVAGLRVESDELIADGDVEDALVALAVGPVADAPRPTVAATESIGAPAFLEPVHPQQLAGCGVDRDGVAVLAGCGVQHAVDHQRRGLQIEVGPLAEIVGLEAPGDLQRVEVGGVDLIERRVARRAKIAAPGPPLAVAGAALGSTRRRWRRDATNEGDQSPFLTAATVTQRIEKGDCPHLQAGHFSARGC